MQDRAHRIHIVGGPGGGKTTIALELGRMLDVPIYDLDEVGYEGGAGDRRPLDVRLGDGGCFPWVDRRSVAGRGRHPVAGCTLAGRCMAHSRPPRPSEPRGRKPQSRHPQAPPLSPHSEAALSQVRGRARGAGQGRQHWPCLNFGPPGALSGQGRSLQVGGRCPGVLGQPDIVMTKPGL